MGDSLVDTGALRLWGGRFTGGPAEAFAWLLGHCAARGRPLKAGDLVTTGAVTGVHDIVAGQTARIDFGTFGEILCRAKPAGPIGEEETVHEQRDRS